MDKEGAVIGKQDDFGLCRMWAEKLFYEKKSDEYRTNGIEEVLQILQGAHDP